MIQAINKILPIPSKSNFTKTMQHESKLKKKIKKLNKTDVYTSFADQLEMACKFN
jgi:hypothetical protein